MVVSIALAAAATASVAYMLLASAEAPEEAE